MRWRLVVTTPEWCRRAHGTVLVSDAPTAIENNFQAVERGAEVVSGHTGKLYRSLCPVPDVALFDAGDGRRFITPGPPMQQIDGADFSFCSRSLWVKESSLIRRKIRRVSLQSSFPCDLFIFGFHSRRRSGSLGCSQQLLAGASFDTC